MVRDKLNTQTKRRIVLAVDLDQKWKMELEGVVHEFPDHKNMSSLVRHVLKEFVGCFLTEQRMRERGLLAPYKALEPPYVLLFALDRAKQLRKENAQGPTTVAVSSSHVGHARKTGTR